MLFKVGDEVDGGVIESVRVCENGLQIAVVHDAMTDTSSIQLHHDDPNVFAEVIKELVLITGKQITVQLPN
jgi:hypothetical protein